MTAPSQQYAEVEVSHRQREVKACWAKGRIPPRSKLPDWIHGAQVACHCGHTGSLERITYWPWIEGYRGCCAGCGTDHVIDPATREKAR